MVLGGIFFGQFLPYIHATFRLLLLSNQLKSITAMAELYCGHVIYQTPFTL